MATQTELGIEDQESGTGKASPPRSPAPLYLLVSSPPRLLLLTLMLVNFVYFGLYANQRHLAFETGAFDVGVYTQPLCNFIHWRDFAVSIIEDNGPIRWATHVEPILFLIAPLYTLW